MNLALPLTLVEDRRSRHAGPEHPALRPRGESWLLFVVLFLVPDLSMLGYLGGPRIGAVSYNLFHTHAPPGMLAAFGLLAGSSLLVSVALVWFSHIGFDRMVGFGLKYPTEFGTPSTNVLTLTVVAIR